ncbi:unnamed protein product, partial [Rotaria magnacalcarata]
MMDPSCTSVAAQTTTQVFHDFVQLEKTIESNETKIQLDNTSLFLVDETTPSEVDSVEMNKLDDASLIKQN